MKSPRAIAAEKATGGLFALAAIVVIGFVLLLTSGDGNPFQ